MSRRFRIIYGPWDNLPDRNNLQFKRRGGARIVLYSSDDDSKSRTEKNII